MKKVAIGCLVVLALAGIAAAGVAYYAYRQVQSTIAQFAELGQVAEIERGLRVRDTFAPPASEELTARQVESFVRVQSHVRQRLGQRFADFESKYKTLSQKETTTLSDLPALMAAYRDMAAAWVDGKRAQVEALNDAGLSLDEYRWIRDQAYRAVGVPYVDFDIGRISEDVKSGNDPTESGQLRGSMGPAGPEVNRKLVEPYKKQLEDSVALASFGL